MAPLLSFLNIFGKPSHVFSRMTQELIETVKIPAYMNTANMKVLVKPDDKIQSFPLAIDLYLKSTLRLKSSSVS